MKAGFCLILSISFLAGCVGSPLHATITHAGLEGKIRKNNSGVMKLSINMPQSRVKDILGTPERSEGYPWGSVWLYRTAMTQGIAGGLYGSQDADYTPLMFNLNDTLEGWGRNYYQQYVNRHELTIKTQNNP